MNSPFGSETKIFNTYKKRDRLFSDIDGGSMKSGFFTSMNSMVNMPFSSYDVDLNKSSHSKSFEFKGSSVSGYKHLELSDYNSNITLNNPSCECASKVLSVLNQLLSYCSSLQNERDRALESLRVEKECKARSISLLNESIARETKLIKELESLREKFSVIKS